MSPAALLGARSAVCAVLPELESCWDCCSIGDLVRLHDLCATDAAFFRPLLVQRRVALLSARLRSGCGGKAAAADASRSASGTGSSGGGCPHVRGAAADGLGELGGAAVGAVPELVRALSDEDKYVCFKAVRALGRLGAASASARGPAVAQLLRLLEDEDDDLRRWASEALLGPLAAAAGELLPRSAPLLDHADAGIRGTALELLSKLRLPNGNAAVAGLMPALARALADDAEEGNRLLAAKLLGTLGDEAAPALPELLRALGDSDGQVRTAAADALTRLGEAGTAQVLPELLALTEHGNKYVCYRAIVVIGRLGPAGAAAVPALALLLADEDADLRLWAAEALRSLGVVAAAAAPRLQGLLENGAEPDAEVRQAARRALESVLGRGAVGGDT
eukprot:TRINITY_DN62808_c0_g1_i1.p1 TRINITY_DN62808_c0_g1~~TRINITY_DN62808_c0_g1_i1.p1  ORF type:complete len:407 (-),score=112.62 TRINITY_DN62808_c0_g1_i1:125-1303(-)